MRILFAIVALASIILVVLGAATPAYQQLLGYPHGEGLYSTLSHICHQYPTRCVWVTNRPMALCTRCFFGYLGLATISSSLLQHDAFKFSLKRLLLGIAALLIAVVDPVVQLLTSYESTNLARAVSGMIGGLAFGMIILPFKKRSD